MGKHQAPIETEIDLLTEKPITAADKVETTTNVSVVTKQAKANLKLSEMVHVQVEVLDIPDEMDK